VTGYAVRLTSKCWYFAYKKTVGTVVARE